MKSSQYIDFCASIQSLIETCSPYTIYGLVLDHYVQFLCYFLVTIQDSASIYYFCFTTRVKFSPVYSTTRI